MHNMIDLTEPCPPLTRKYVVGSDLQDRLHALPDGIHDRIMMAIVEGNSSNALRGFSGNMARMSSTCKKSLHVATFGSSSATSQTWRDDDMDTMFGPPRLPPSSWLVSYAAANAANAARAKLHVKLVQLLPDVRELTIVFGFTSMARFVRIRVPRLPSLRTISLRLGACVVRYTRTDDADLLPDNNGSGSVQLLVWQLVAAWNIRRDEGSTSGGSTSGGSTWDMVYLDTPGKAYYDMRDAAMLCTHITVY